MRTLGFLHQTITHILLASFTLGAIAPYGHEVWAADKSKNGKGSRLGQHRPLPPGAQRGGTPGGGNKGFQDSPKNTNRVVRQPVQSQSVDVPPPLVAPPFNPNNPVSPSFDDANFAAMQATRMAFNAAKKAILAGAQSFQFVRNFQNHRVELEGIYFDVSSEAERDRAIELIVNKLHRDVERDANVSRHLVIENPEEPAAIVNDVEPRITIKHNIERFMRANKTPLHVMISFLRGAASAGVQHTAILMSAHYGAGHLPPEIFLENAWKASIIGWGGWSFAAHMANKTFGWFNQKVNFGIKDPWAKLALRLTGKAWLTSFVTITIPVLVMGHYDLIPHHHVSALGDLIPPELILKSAEMAKIQIFKGPWDTANYQVTAGKTVKLNILKAAYLRARQEYENKGQASPEVIKRYEEAVTSLEEEIAWGQFWQSFRTAALNVAWIPVTLLAAAKSPAAEWARIAMSAAGVVLLYPAIQKNKEAFLGYFDLMLKRVETCKVVLEVEEMGDFSNLSTRD